MGNTVCWLMLITTMLTLLLTYSTNLTSLMYATMWFIWLLVTLLILYFSDQGKKLILLVKDARIELAKVVWPSRQETIQISIIVIVAVMITGLVLWAIDSGMMWGIGKITHLG